jgi:hypothetical protein
MGSMGLACSAFLVLARRCHEPIVSRVSLADALGHKFSELLRHVLLLMAEGVERAGALEPAPPAIISAAANQQQYDDDQQKCGGIHSVLLVFNRIYGSIEVIKKVRNILILCRLCLALIAQGCA